jgi:hypothetical protein
MTKIKITSVSWTREPFSATVYGHTVKEVNGQTSSWDWEIPFSNPLGLISFLCEDIYKRNKPIDKPENIG